MTDRERLIELLEKAFEFHIDDPYCIPDEGEFADYLLANGVIVPPCKVGDKVYVVDKRLGVWWKGEVSSVGYVDQNNIEICVIYDYGEVAICDADTVFLTKEEAEEKLKELNDNE